MNWFLVYFFAMGMVLGIVSMFIKKNIRKAVETKGFKRDAAFRKVDTWLLTYAWVIIFIAIGFSTQLIVYTNKEFKKVDSRIERIEKQMNLPTVDTLYIKNLLKNE